MLSKMLQISICMFLLWGCALKTKEVPLKLALWDEQTLSETAKIQVKRIDYRQSWHIEDMKLENLLLQFREINDANFWRVTVNDASSFVAKYEIVFLDKDDQIVTSFQLASNQYIKLGDVWYENREMQFPFDVFRDIYDSHVAYYRANGDSFASYLKIPHNLSIEKLAQYEQRSAHGGNCWYQDIFRMDLAKVKELCFYEPVLILDEIERLKHQTKEKVELADLLGQVYDHLVALEPKVNQKYAPILRNLQKVSESEYRKAVILQSYNDRHQCGFDISIYSPEELADHSDYIIRAEALGNSKSFLRGKRWPDYFDEKDDWTLSSFPFQVLESYYGNLQQGNIGELVYLGGVIDEKLMDCGRSFEDYQEGEEFLLLLKKAPMRNSNGDIPVFEEVHFFHNTIMKLDAQQKIRLAIDRGVYSYFNSGTDYKEIVSYLLEQKSRE